MKPEDALIAATLRLVAEESGVAFIDLAAMAGSWPKEGGLLATCVHLAGKGTAFIADRLSGALVPLVGEPPGR